MENEWKIGKLSDIAFIEMGQSPDGSSCNKNGIGIPILNGPTEFCESHPKPIQYTKNPKKFAKKNDILFCVRGSTTGKINWSDQEYAIGRGIAAIRHINGDLYRYFLKALLDYKLPSLLAAATGSTFPNVSKDQLNNLSCTLPPLSIQYAISKILGNIDYKIELNREMNETLEGMARAIFNSWFVDFDPVKAKAAGHETGLPPEIECLFPDRFEDSELGPIPKGWNYIKLNDSVGINSDSVKKEDINGEIEYLDISSVTAGKLTEYKRMNFSDAPSRARRKVKDGDTIWSCVRPNRKSYYFIHNPPPNLIVSTGFVVLTPKKVTPNYLYAYTTTQEFVDYLTNNADGSAYPAVRAEHFASADLLFPDRFIMNTFENIVEPIRNQIVYNERESRNLLEIRDTLLPRLISGEIRVPERCEGLG